MSSEVVGGGAGRVALRAAVEPPLGGHALRKAWLGGGPRPAVLEDVGHVVVIVRVEQHPHKAVRFLKERHVTRLFGAQCEVALGRVGVVELEKQQAATLTARDLAAAATEHADGADTAADTGSYTATDAGSYTGSHAGSYTASHASSYARAHRLTHAVAVVCLEGQGHCD